MYITDDMKKLVRLYDHLNEGILSYQPSGMPTECHQGVKYVLRFINAIWNIDQIRKDIAFEGQD